MVINEIINIIPVVNEDHKNKKIKHKFTYNKIETKTITIQLHPPSDGIINDLSKNGYGDITLIINEKKQKIFKDLLLIQQNEYLSSLIKESNNNEIKLTNEINEYEFKLMMKYYGYTKIDLNGENVILLMKASYILKDMKIYNQMKKYIIFLNFYIISRYLFLCHFTSKSIDTYFKNESYIEENDRQEIETEMKIFISTNIDELLNESEIIDFSVDSLLRIVSVPILLIEDEKKYANKLLYYYNYYESNGRCIYFTSNSIVSLDFKSTFKEISHYIKWDLLQKDSLINSSFLVNFDLKNQDVCKTQHLYFYKNDFNIMIIRCYYTNCDDELETYIENNSVINKVYSRYCKYSELDGILSKICIIIIIVI